MTQEQDDNIITAVFVAAVAVVIIVSVFCGFNIDEEEWIPLDAGCYLHVEHDRSMFHANTDTTTTLCPK